jgi:hypothetical protein
MDVKEVLGSGFWVLGSGFWVLGRLSFTVFKLLLQTVATVTTKKQALKRLQKKRYTRLLNDGYGCAESYGSESFTVVLVKYQGPQPCN